MQERFKRTELLIGAAGTDRLANARIAVFGVGGVGGYTLEALARSGVGHLDIIDHDTISTSNINRQIIALDSTVGRYKVDVMKERILDINPKACVRSYQCFYLPENAHRFNFSEYDYVVDAVDTVTAKLEIAVQANLMGIPLISSMGAGNKLDPTRFEVADIYSTSVCPLARVMRRELKARGIPALKVVYSRESALKPEAVLNKDETQKRETPGSMAFVPSVAGLIMAGEVIKDILGSQGGKGRVINGKK